MFDQEKWQEWASKLKPISIGIAGLILASVFIYKWTSGNKKSGLEDYLSASATYEKWSSDPSLDNWQKLQKKMDPHPELYQKFGARIAQKYLYKGEVSHYYFQSLSRNQESLGLYADYARTSEKIAQNQYEKALEEALHLKKQIPSDQLGFLYALNLVRIASLQKELGLQGAELESWKELRSFSATDSPSQDLFTTEIGKKLASHFREGQISLEDYILYREKLISPY